ncbi:MAG: hypothetical protein A3F73_12080 [Gallionellales bacterium RIFCSPLOWO2_12_FULL_59_22]|nr:MAG: hypothetical protein A3F73_12080 [Gallionellales bacterium RIFCSPLOWO2_12_FULL_59_22]
MRIGIDFDNTLASYDKAFTELAQERGLIGMNENKSKQDIRQLARQKENGEILWQRLQGEIYGPRMQEAEQFAGEDQFLRRCAATPGVQIFIISHKTEFGHFDKTRTNLRDAACQWMRNKGFFDPTKYAIPEKHLFFESTQQEKVARISSLQCDVFIDDLVDLFSIPSFPRTTKRILFSDDMPCELIGQVDYICACWSEVEAIVFGN